MAQIITRVPAPLSLNQMVPSDFTTASFGPVSRFHFETLRQDGDVPSSFGPGNRCVSCSQLNSLPCRSRVLYSYGSTVRETR